MTGSPSWPQHERRAADADWISNHAVTLRLVLMAGALTTGLVGLCIEHPEFFHSLVVAACGSPTACLSVLAFRAGFFLAPLR